MTVKASRELLSKLSDYVAERMGLHFPKERLDDLERGLERAAPDFGFKDAKACARWLLQSALTKKQIETLAGRLTVGETYFFRDKKSFDLLEDEVLPELIRKRRGTEKYLRIWSAGCATGEEPYSIAMLLLRLIPDIAEWNITILATDINNSFLEKARNGLYGEWSFREVPSWVKERFFKKAGKGHFELLPAVRRTVTFFYHNLAEDAYPSLANNTNAMDLILCRNVLMYFNDKNQHEVVRKFHRCLVSGGWLMVGPAEISAVQSSPFLKEHSSGSTLYRKDAEICLFAGDNEPPLPLSASETSVSVSPPLRAMDEVAGDLAAPPFVVPPASKKEEHTYAEALKLYEQGCYSDAEDKISALLAGDDNNGPALALLSRVHANQGRLTNAFDLCERAISADRLNPAYQYLLATILLEMGREEESKTCLNRTLYLDQDFALAHFALGNLFRRKGKKRESERHFKNALSVLRTYRPDNIVPQSEGITAERMIEIINTTAPEGTLS